MGLNLNPAENLVFLIINTVRWHQVTSSLIHHFLQFYFPTIRSIFVVTPKPNIFNEKYTADYPNAITNLIHSS